jgi:endonuclease YncB( thermonuclease family)
MYTYSAIVTEVIDADTIVCNIDLGMYVWMRSQRIRLARTYAPEKKTPEGKKLADWLRGLIHGQTITLRTQMDRKEKYGRWLGEIELNGEGINDLVIARCGE